MDYLPFLKLVLSFSILAQIVVSGGPNHCQIRQRVAFGPFPARSAGCVRTTNLGKKSGKSQISLLLFDPPLRYTSAVVGFGPFGDRIPGGVE